MDSLFAKVIVDIANSSVDRLFTYSVPGDIKVEIGQRVLVPFGRSNRPVEGIVLEICDDYTVDFELKSVSSVLEPYSVLLSDQIKLSHWLARAYHCTLCDCLRLMLPAQLRGSRVKEKTVRTVKVADNIDTEKARTSLLKKDGTPKAPKQFEVFEFLYRSGMEMSVADLRAFIPDCASAVSALIKKGYLSESGHITFRSPFKNNITNDTPPPLTDDQSAALEKIESAYPGDCLLLHGVTGSGKTEVYLNAIQSVLEDGGGAIVLVPEISLTPQTTDRFRKRFGDTVAVLHSHLSAGERYDEWRRLRLGRARVVVGARSALFAPVANLKLIIIDEEHEPSYHSNAIPRYSTDEVAIRRARICGAKLILGSATPQLISYLRAKQGAYKLVELPNRVNGIPMPEVEIVDMRSEFMSGNDGIFSSSLKRRLVSCIEKGEQAILFLNRRGYSSHAECRACGFVFTCPNCDVALTYHKFDDLLRCHYCGFSSRAPSVCPECGSKFIKYTGIGTQQVEEQLVKLIPGVRYLRMDTDTTGGKTSHRDILDSFSKGEADVLIGTQMVAKGLDIPGVTLVGVVFADSSLFHCDYHSSERTFQLLTQVAGRAGRASSDFGSLKNGRVVIQTNAPYHRAVQFASKHDYIGFYNLEIQDRLKTLFPPFSVFIRILFENRDEGKAASSSAEFAQVIEERLRSILSEIGAEKELIFVVSGAAPIRKREGLYRYAILIKLARTKHTSNAITALWELGDNCNIDGFKGIEINPHEML